MILGYMTHAEQEGVIYPAALRQGLAYLRNTDFSQVADGKYSIDGEKLMAIVAGYFPDVKKNRPAETHQQYIDIQYIAAGEEIIGWGRVADGVPKPEGYLPEKDATFYENVNNESDIKVSAGMYAVFFPWDIHRPGCISRPDVNVRKVVIKVKVSSVL